MENKHPGSWSALCLSETSHALLQQYYQESQSIGISTAAYVRLVIERGRIEKTMVEGCRAIIRLSRVFGSQRLEAACHRALQGKKYNYNTIKSILINHLDTEEDIPPDSDKSHIGQHENLRGRSSYE